MLAQVGGTRRTRTTTFNPAPVLRSADTDRWQVGRLADPHLGRLDPCIRPGFASLRIIAQCAFYYIRQGEPGSGNRHIPAGSHRQRAVHAV